MCYSTSCWCTTVLCCGHSVNELSVALYCAVLYIAACVDASRTVFWDRSVLNLALGLLDVTKRPRMCQKLLTETFQVAWVDSTSGWETLGSIIMLVAFL